jgi:uncharacterized membrane protein
VIWVRRLFLVGLILFCGGLALGFGFDEGGEEVGFADAMTSIAGVMYLTSLVTFPVTVLLFLAMLMPKPMRPGQGRSNRLVLGAIYALWLIVPLAVLVGVRSDSCMANGSCNEWGGGQRSGGLDPRAPVLSGLVADATSRRQAYA